MCSGALRAVAGPCGETVDTGEGYFAKARVSIAKLWENHLQRLRGPLSFQEE